MDEKTANAIEYEHNVIVDKDTDQYKIGGTINDTDGWLPIPEKWTTDLKTLAERLNFSDQKEHKSAIKIPKWRDINHYETLCLYCSDNDIDLDLISDHDFDSCPEIMKHHGQKDKALDHYYFWIDK